MEILSLMGMLLSLYNALFGEQPQPLAKVHPTYELQRAIGLAGEGQVATEEAKALYRKLGIQSAMFDEQGNLHWNDEQGNKKKLKAEKVNPALYETEETRKLEALFRQLYAIKS